MLDYGRVNGSCIETVSGRGYRFIAPVTRCARDSAEPSVLLADACSLEPRPSSISSAERRQLTVMICDLVGSAALSSQLDPEDLREIIAAYHRVVAEVVAGFDGLVVKYMVDGVLAYFGYPQAHEDDAERAVRAGLSLIAAIGRLNVKSAKLQVQVGIATGLVVVGDLIGDGSVQEQSVAGEAPHLAARMKTLAEPDTVAISAGTHRLVGNFFEYRDLGTVEVNGIARPLSAWRVLRPSAVASRFEALRGSVLSPLVGRDEEIDLLLRRWVRAKAGDGQVLLISGEPGIGKSRVAAELEKRLQTEQHFCLRYFCSPSTRTVRFTHSSTSSARQRGSNVTTRLLPGWRSSRLCSPAQRRLTKTWPFSPISWYCRLPSPARCRTSARSGGKNERWRL